MEYEISVNGRARHVTVHRVGTRFVVAIDGRAFTVDAARVDAHTLSLLVKGSGGFSGAGPGSGTTAGFGPKAQGSEVEEPPDPFFSHEVTLSPDPGSGGLSVRVGGTPVAVSFNGRRRRGGADPGADAGAGPQRLVAPMPGRIVRVLVKTGEAVAARQPLVVIEAMKMENELRAASDGRVAEIHVVDGQSVDAGALLAVIHR